MTGIRRTALRSLTFLALGVAVVGLEAIPAEGQYFGRNNVQYRTFDFQIIETEHFDVHYYPEGEVAARDAARMAERWYDRLSRILNHRFEERQPLILYATHPDFQQTTTTGQGIGEGVQGFTEVFKQRVVMPMLGSYQDTDHLIGHELVHAFQFDISGIGRAGAGIEQAARRFQAPLWFMEGMAEYLAIGPVDPNTAMWMRDAALTGDVPTIRQMTQQPGRFFPYRWGQALFSYIGGTWGDAVIGQILRQMGQGVPMEQAFQRILNISIEDLSDDFQASIRRTYLPLVEDREMPREVADPILVQRDGRGEGGRLNIGPSLSPDGERVVFLSELRDLDVAVYLADARTGEVIRRLQRGTAFDPHFGSLRFIASAGDWSPDGQRFVFSALRAGSDRLVIIDAERGRRIQEIRIPGVHEISNPTWSPDGTTIVASGIEGGLGNLYAIDVETGEARKLTDDRYAAMQPHFSPDGQTLAFVTDRGPDTNFETLAIGNYRIALMDFETGEVTALPNMDVGKNINPNWSRDGASIYYISNRTGAPNIYRTEIATGDLYRITNLFTGVSGITDMSPSLTVAREANRLLFSAYEEGGYNIYGISDRTRLAGTQVVGTQLVEGERPEEPLVEEVTIDGEDADPRMGWLPPVPRSEEAAFNRVRLALEDPVTGLPTAAQAAAWEPRGYTPRLSLDYLGQPQVGVSVGGAFGGAGLQGGIFGMFSDMLGRHTVAGAIQAQGLIDEVGFQGTYLYTRDRWNYGFAAQRVPMIGAFYGQDVEVDDAGNPVAFLDQLQRYRLFDWRVTGIAQYPFSRQQRLEFMGGARRMVESVRILENVYPIRDGQIVPQIIDQRERTETGATFNFLEGTAALVYDNALFNFTSPFAGQRYRFELSGMFGGIQMANALADYRRYFFLRPFTVAVRGYHLGRYGRDAEGLFRPLHIGQPWAPWQVRGYDPNDIAQECRVAPGAGCPLLDETLGSRLGVANAELRFPLFQQLVVAGIGLPPIEGFLFGDAGVAWARDASPTFDRGIQPGDNRGIFTSIGAGGRLNLLGMFILEVAYVNPLDRPRGPHWQFGLQPGF